MLNQKITVLVQSMVAGPTGKLKPGQVVELDDSPYVRVLIKSGAVSLIDPPSLDPDYLKKAGYEEKEETKMLTRAPKKEELPKEPPPGPRVEGTESKEVAEPKKASVAEPEDFEPVSVDPVKPAGEPKNQDLN